MSGKEVWEEYPEIWSTKSSYFSWLRGGLRRVWSKCPVKIVFMQSNRFRIPSPRGGNYKPVWGAVCELCEETFQQKDLQVDHGEEVGSLKDFEDLAGFTKRLLAPAEGTLRFVCKPCHKIHSHSQRFNLTFEEARVAKLVIAKMKLPVSEQKTILANYSVLEVDMSNSAKRKESFEIIFNTGGEI